MQAVEGAAQSGKLVGALAAGDKVDANDDAFGTSFPYVALPHQGAVNVNRAGGPGTGAGMALGDRSPASASAEPAAAPGLKPASADAADRMRNSALIVVAIVGAGALLTLAASWLLRRRRSTRNDDTIAF